MVRVLHVVGAMNRGGAETWLMHILRHIDRERFQMDFVVHTTRPAAYDDEIRALGSQIIPCLHPRYPLTYAHNLKRILREYGPYDIIHSHVHHYSGWVLRIAHQAGVPMRVAHSHSDTSFLQANASVLRRLYFMLMQRWIAQCATRGWGCSRAAAAALFGPEWASDPRWRVLYHGIDLRPFHQVVHQGDVRAELSIPPEAFVVGHVGRFVEPKNHLFLLDIAREVIRREPRARFVLVGDGHLRAAMAQRVEEMGLREYFIFTGERSDIPRVMLGAIDLFVFPSLYEGLPIVLVEAQAAGLPCLISNVITQEVEVVPSLFQRLDLAQPAAVWAETALAMRCSLRPTQAEALAQVEKSVFNVHISVRELEKEYDG